MLADTRPSGDDVAVEAIGKGSPRHSGARLLGRRVASAWRRGGARPPARVVEAVDGGGVQVGARAGGRGIRDEGDEQSTELYAESLFRWQKGNFACHFTVSRPNPPAPVGFER